MRKCTIWYNQTAIDDIETITDFIEKELFEPHQAERFVKGIIKKIEELEILAPAYMVQRGSYYDKLGLELRRLNYRGFAILYIVRENIVVVKRIVHGSLIYDAKH